MQGVGNLFRETVSPVLLLGRRQAAPGAVVRGGEVVVAVGGGGGGSGGLVLSAARRRTQVVGVVIVRWGLRMKKGHLFSSFFHLFVVPIFLLYMFENGIFFIFWLLLPSIISHVYLATTRRKEGTSLLDIGKRYFPNAISICTV